MDGIVINIKQRYKKAFGEKISKAPFMFSISYYKNNLLV